MGIISDVGLLTEKALDTVEDALLHIRRMGLEGADDEHEQVPMWDEDTKDNRPVVVVLGTGWSAHALMKVVDTSLFRVLVVSPRNYFCFTPMLAASSVGTVEYRSICEPARVSNPLIEYVEGTAVSVNPDAQELEVELVAIGTPMSSSSGDATGGAHASSGVTGAAGGGMTRVRLRYDTLVVACGARVSAAIVPGAEARCHKLKEVGDAQRLRKAIGEAFDLASRPGTPEGEQRRLLHFVIVGGGPTGVELAGELTDFCNDVAKMQGYAPKVSKLARVTVLQSAPGLLPQFEPRLRGEAQRRLESRGATVRTNVRVVRVDNEVLHLSDKGAPTGTAPELLPYGLCVWCAGTVPQPFVQQLLDDLPPAASAPGGRVAVDSWLRVRMGDTRPDLRGSIFAMGDVAFECGDDQQSALEMDACEPLPQTAQVAAQQGAFMARLLNRDYDLKVAKPRLSPAKPIAPDADAVTEFWQKLAKTWVSVRGLEEAPPFRFLNLGILAYIGGGEAISQLQLGDVTLSAQAGSTAFLLWRSVYLVKQVALRNRLLVTFDWVKSAVFGRDLTRF